jgi:outer membrane protein assembly factor BamB
MRIVWTVVALGLSALPARAEDVWAQFRGPNGTGLSGAKNLPTRWDEKTNIVWKTAIHDKGWSSPVVWGKQVWLTTARADGKELYALCIDRDSGKVLRDLKVFDVPRPAFCHPFNSYASPTPVIEAGRVYVHFGTYGTACLDTNTGKKLWERRDLDCDHWRGPGSSPILWNDFLYLTFDGHDKQYVVCLNKKDGSTVWKQDRTIDYGTNDGDYKKAYSTPSIILVNGQYQLVSPAAVATIAYDPRTGREIWKVYHGGMNAAAPPVYGSGNVIIAPGDVRGGHKLLAVRPDGKGDVSKTHVAWGTSKSVPTRPAPILVGELLYMVDNGGVASCLEVKTGKPVWTKRLGARSAFTSSPVCAGGHLYIFDEAGLGYVLKAGRKAEVVAVNALADGCMSTPAVAGRALFVRTRSHLYRIEKK